MPETNTTCTAQWAINQYTVRFNANGGVGGTSVAQNYGSVIVAPTVTREGYTFAGWQPAPLETVPASNVTYTAQWQVNQYTVTFDANGGEGGTNGTQDYGTVIVAPTVTREGYAFAGWQPAPLETVPASNVTYIAQWTANQYTVTFDPNGGAGDAMADQVFTYGTAQNLARVTYTLSGYTFLGWSADRDATSATYADGESVLNLATSGHLTLYALWEAAAVPAPGDDVPYEGYGLVEAVSGVDNAAVWPFRVVDRDAVSGGYGFTRRSGVEIVLPENPIEVDNTASGANLGDDGDKRIYISSPAWAPQEVYQTEVYGASTTTLGGFTPGGSYIAEIHFAETYQSNQNRVFRCRANGVTLVCGVRPSDNGFGVAHTFSAEVQANASGQIVFELANYSDNGIFGGYSVWGTEAPTFPSAAIVGSGRDVVISWSDAADVHRFYIETADSPYGPWINVAVLMPEATGYTVPDAYSLMAEKYWRVVASNGVSTVSHTTKLGDTSAIDFTDIATLGETVASNASANYRVAFAGTGNLNKLGAAVTDAAMYVNGYSVPHTLAIASGETLKAGMLGVLSGAGDMTVGNAVGQGVVSPSEGVLVLDVKREGSTLTLNAQARKSSDDDMISKFGGGVAKLAGGTDIASIAIGSGSVEVPYNSDATFDKVLSGVGTFTKTGSGRVDLDGTAKSSAFSGTVEVKEGALRLATDDGASIFDQDVTVKIDSGATLDVGNPNAVEDNKAFFGKACVVFEGTGANGYGGAIVNNSGRSQYNMFARGALSGDATVDTASRFDFRGRDGVGRFDFNGHSLTKTGSSSLYFTSVSVYAGEAGAALRVVDGGVGIEASTTFSGDGTARLANNARAAFYYLSAPVSWSLFVEATGGCLASYGGTCDGYNNWSGPVSIAAGGTLVVAPDENTGLRITGKISGTGKLLRSSGGSSAYVKIENAANDWTGGTEVSNGILYFTCAAALPGYDEDGRVTVSGTGKIAVKVGSGGTDGWSQEQISALLAHVTAPEGAKGAILIDTAGLDVKSGVGTVTKSIGIAKTGEGAYTSEMAYTAGGGIYADQGTLVISNKAANTMNSLQVIKSGRVEIYDSEIDFGSNDLHIGNVRSDGDIPSLVLGNGAYVHSYLAPAMTKGVALWLGSSDAGGGILEVQDGAVISNKLFMGNSQYSQSAVYQSGGEIVNWGGHSSDTVFANSQYSWGYWEVAGTGSTAFMGYSQIAKHPSGYGMLAIRDEGSVLVTNVLQGTLTMSRGGHAAIDQTGGRFETAVEFTMGDANDNSGANGTAVYEMRGGTANIGGDVGASVRVADRKNFIGQVNFNGGEFAAKDLYKAAKEDAKAYATFNGGTFKAKVDGVKMFGDAVENKLDGVYVYEKGAAFDTNGKNVTLGHVLRSPTGLGVKAIRWTQADAAKLKWKGPELMGPPMVVIEGDGAGATAVVDFDTSTRTVKGIIVTCPGWGYTEKPVVKLIGGGLFIDNSTQFYTINDSAVVMGESSSGPIVKKGEGMLTLDGENGVAGAEVRGGTLTVPASASIQPGKLTLVGGKFSAQSYTATELVVEGGADAVSTLDARLTICEGRVFRKPGLYMRFANGEYDKNMTATEVNKQAVVLELAYADTPLYSGARVSEGIDIQNNNLGCAYDGYIWNRTGSVATWTFAELFDDNTYLVIDDEVVLDDTSWNSASIKTISVEPGPHKFHLVVYQGGGESGPATGTTYGDGIWFKDAMIGVGIDYQGRGEKVSDNYVRLIDPGDGSLFTLTPDDDIEQSFAPEALLHVNGGTLRLPTSRPGLFGGFVAYRTHKGANSPCTGVYPGLDYANTAYGDTDEIDGNINNQIGYVFEGYIWNHGEHDVTWTFAENFDDDACLTIDGVVVLDNGGWNVPTKGNCTLSPGPHAIRIGLNQNTGGSGPSSQGWLNTAGVGIGIDFEGRDAEVPENYVPLTASAAGGDKPLLTTSPRLPGGGQMLPQDVAVAVSGGGRVELDGGTYTVDNLFTADAAFTNGTLKVSGTWTVDYADIERGAVLQVQAMDVDGAALAITGSTDMLDCSKTYVLANAEQGIVGTVQLVSSLPSGWNVEVRGNDLVLVYSGTGGATDVVVDVGNGKTVAVPRAWLSEKTERAATDTAANGRKVWECYVLGLDPEKTDDFIIATFQMNADGTPNLSSITTDPPEETWNVRGARAVLMGATTLEGDVHWQPVTDKNKAQMRFFKVEVVLP